MKIDLRRPADSNFESTGKDLKDIMFKLAANPNLMRLLKHSTPDALNKPPLSEEEVASLINTNIRVVPRLPISEEVGSYIIIMFDNFIENATNPVYRDNLIMIDVICHTDTWIMDDYMLRPYKIMHEIDKMFNGQKLNGIGTIEYVSANSLLLSSELAGYTLTYRVVNDA